MILVSGWFHVSKTIIPEAGSTFSPLHHDATIIFSVGRGLGLPLGDGAWDERPMMIPIVLFLLSQECFPLIPEVAA